MTKAQHDVIRAIKGGETVDKIGARHSISTASATALVAKLLQSGILESDRDKEDLLRPATPQALSFWVHTTNKCNLGCSYCYISTLQTTGGMSETVRAQLLIKLIEVVKNRGIRKVKLRLAGGEPLLQFKNWRSFVPHAREQLKNLGCELEISFITNLTLLTDEMITFAKAEAISFGVSLDGIQVAHDQSRSFLSGRGSFDTVEKNLRRLVEHGLTISTTTVLTNKNLSGLPELTQYLINLNIPFRYSIVRGDSIDAGILEDSLNRSFDTMAMAVEQGWSASTKFRFCDLKPSELGFQTCDSGFSGGAINVDGAFNYCHVHFGNAAEKGTSIFRDDLDLVDMIEHGSHYEDVRSADCRKCPYRMICTSGCPVYRVNGKDPQCSIYHKFIPRIFDLHAMERLQLLRFHGIIPA